MSESIQVVLFTSVSGITDRYVKISAIKGEDRWKYHLHTDGELQPKMNWLLVLIWELYLELNCPFLICSSFMRMKVASLSVIGQLLRPPSIFPYNPYFLSCSGHDFLRRLTFAFIFLSASPVQGIIYLHECLFHFLRGDILICDRSGITQFLFSDGAPDEPELDHFVE